jgi:sugar phosphate isomerase/epimerase
VAEEESAVAGTVKIGITSWTCRWAIRAGLSAQGAVELAAAVNAEGLQFCEDLPLWDLGPREREVVQTAAREHKVVLELGTRSVEEPHIRHCIDLTARLGRSILRLALGEHDLERVDRVLRSVLPHARASGIILALENQFDIPSAELARLVERVDDPALAVCLDVGNSVGFLERPLEATAMLAPFAVQLHVKDFAVEKLPQGYRVRGCPIGDGIVDTRAVLEVLRRVGRAPDIFIEQWMDPEDSSERTLEKEREWITTGIRSLRELLAEGGATRP